MQIDISRSIAMSDLKIIIYVQERYTFTPKDALISFLPAAHLYERALQVRLFNYSILVSNLFSILVSNVIFFIYSFCFLALFFA